MYRVRQWRDNFNESDPVTQGIALIALILLVVIAIPYLPVPWVASGVECTEMSSPKLNGNNGSILAEQPDQAEALHLEVVPDPILVNAGEPLRFGVRFINEGVAPMNLFLRPGDYVLRFTGQEDGLVFSVTTDPRTGQPLQALGEPVNVHPVAIAPQQYVSGDVRTLRPRQRCTVSVEISPQRLAAAGIGPGQFVITAVYQNRSRGAVPGVQPLTPTPIFADQGIWIGKVESNKVTLVINVPTAAPPQ